jgi:hypothetical protein
MLVLASAIPRPSAAARASGGAQPNERRQEVAKMTEIVTRRRAMPGFGGLVLGLALVIGGCAGNTSMSTGSDDLFDSYDSDGDDMLSQPEWDQVHINLDSNGDGAVSRDEFNASFGGRGGR